MRRKPWAIAPPTVTDGPIASRISASCPASAISEATSATQSIQNGVEPARMPLGLISPLMAEGSAISASATVISSCPSWPMMAFASSQAAEIDSLRICPLSLPFAYYAGAAVRTQRLPIASLLAISTA